MNLSIIPPALLSSGRLGCVPVLLAGGLTPENVCEAAGLWGVVGVDVSSGVEKAPGLKDLEKMRRFIYNAKQKEKKKEGN